MDEENLAFRVNKVKCNYSIVPSEERNISRPLVWNNSFNFDGSYDSDHIEDYKSINNDLKLFTILVEIVIVIVIV